MRHLGTLVGATFLAATLGISAADRKDRMNRDIPKAAWRVVDAQEAEKNAKATTREIRWLTSLPEAQAQARQEGKLVFWMHMLGDLNGMT